MPARPLSIATAALSAVYVVTLFLPWRRYGPEASPYEWAGLDNFLGAASCVAALALVAWELLNLLQRRTGSSTLAEAATRLALLTTFLAIAALVHELIGRNALFGDSDDLAWGWWISLFATLALVVLSAARLRGHFLNRP